MKVSSKRNINRRVTYVSECNNGMSMLSWRVMKKYPVVDYPSYVYNDKAKSIRSKHNVDGTRR